MSVDKKEFALSQLAPYFKDPNSCGMDSDNCQYLTDDGLMCVAGKNMLDSVRLEYARVGVSIEDILNTHEQHEIFDSKVVDVLNTHEWSCMQRIHDNIAMADNYKRNKYFEQAAKCEGVIKAKIEHLDLFTYDELVAYAEKL